MKIFKNKYKILLYIFFILLLNVACKKEIEYKALYGTLTGYVYLYENANFKMPDNSGVEIVLEGSDPEIKTVTDESGRFLIEDLKSGTYNIIFNKEGYCQHKIIGFKFVGGDIPAAVYKTHLYALPKGQIDSLWITGLEWLNYNKYLMGFNISMQNENGFAYGRYYLGENPDVSYNNYISTDIMVSLYSGSSYIQLQIDTIRFPTGSELYMIIYPATETFQSYTDINTGNEIFTSINVNNPSNVASITIPGTETP